MYESAIPPETQSQIESMEPARLVVGIPSYRNLDTVSQVTRAVAQGMDQHYHHLKPVLVNTDGHSFDQTLSRAMNTPVPSSVRRIGTRYHGLPGKGSAIRTILEISARLGARACAIVEADVTSVTPDWIPALVGPVISGEFDIIVPHYLYQRPPAGCNDLLIHPLLHVLYGIDLYTPTAGEMAINGFLAARLTDKDVWETDVARAGINVWITTMAILDGFKVGQVRLGQRLHHSAGGHRANKKFMQQVGTIFRLGYLYRRQWQQDGHYHVAPLQGRWPYRARRSDNSWPSTDNILPIIKTGMERYGNNLWPTILRPENFERIQALLEQKAGTFPVDLWSRIVYDFFVVYNMGEGDPDRVIESLFPLYHARMASFLETGREMDEEGRVALIAKQVASFIAHKPYLLELYNTYTPWLYDSFLSLRGTA